MTNRQPKGTPVGGQFAEGRNPEGGDLPVKEIRVVDHSNSTNPNGYQLFDGDTPGARLCDGCAKERLSLEQLQGPNVSPLGNLSGDTDSPSHCDFCEALIYEPLTPDGVEYVRDAVENNEGRPEVLAAWREAYPYIFEEEDSPTVVNSLDVRTGPGGIREWFKNDEFIPPPIGTEITVAEARALPSYVEVMATFDTTGDKEFRLMARDLPRYSDDEHESDSRIARRFTNLDTGFEVFVGGLTGLNSPEGAVNLTKIRVSSHG